MNELRSFILVVFGLAVAITVSILSMVYGWGVHPKSWGWIIGCGFFGQVLAQIIITVAKTK